MTNRLLVTYIIPFLYIIIIIIILSFMRHLASLIEMNGVPPLKAGSFSLSRLPFCCLPTYREKRASKQPPSRGGRAEEQEKNEWSGVEKERKKKQRSLAWTRRQEHKFWLTATLTEPVVRNPLKAGNSLPTFSPPCWHSFLNSFNGNPVNQEARGGELTASSWLFLNAILSCISALL